MIKSIELVNVARPIAYIFTLVALTPSCLNAQSNIVETVVDKANLQEDFKNYDKDISELKNEILELKKQLDDEPESVTSPLLLNGFFDVLATANSENDQPFSLGALELDIQYDQLENFAVSAALVWADDAAEVAVAVLDYHVSSHTVPTRGNLFGEAGYHIQIGRFDIPFGNDYEYFASVDRPNITAPLTTDRLQGGGFNSDGIRAYGSWEQLDYAVFWANSFFEEQGTSLGGRIGYTPTRDYYRIHNRDKQGDFVVGFSWINNINSEQEKERSIYAFDLTFSYGMTTLIMEYISSKTDRSIILFDETNAGLENESGFNARLVFDLDSFNLFMSYEQWEPEYTHVFDEDNESISYAVDDLERAIVGINYSFYEYLQLKLEYLNHLNRSTEEPGFENDRLTFQMVASF